PTPVPSRGLKRFAPGLLPPRPRRPPDQPGARARSGHCSLAGAEGSYGASARQCETARDWRDAGSRHPGARSYCPPKLIIQPLSRQHVEHPTMIVSWNWLTDYLRLDMPMEVLTERLALTGLNLESIAEVGGDIAIDLEVTSNRP